MSAWPNADRLRAALDSRAERASVSPDALDRILETASADVTLIPEPKQPSHGPQRFMLIAAAIVLIVGAAGYALTRARSNDGIQAVAPPETTSPIDTEPPPLFPGPGTCAETGTTPTLYRLDDAGTQIVYSATETRSGGPALYIGVGSERWPTAALEHPLTGAVAQAATIAIEVDAGSAMAPRTLDPVLPDPCFARGLFLLIADGDLATNETTVALYCADLRGAGFAGLVIVGELPTPPPCQLRHSALLATTSDPASAQAQAWTAAAGCSADAAPSDQADLPILEFAGCATPLRLWPVADSADPWQGEQSLTGYLATLDFLHP